MRYVPSTTEPRMSPRGLWIEGDLLDHNCRQHGPMGPHVLVTSLMQLIRFWFGFFGCGTSLLYHVPSGRKPRRTAHVVSGRRVTSADVVGTWRRVG
jgi:hypothetical protein